MDTIYKYPSVTAKVLRSLRLKNQYTQKYVSELIGKSRSTISRIENAIKRLSGSELKEYLKSLNTSYDEFLKTVNSLNLLNDLSSQPPVKKDDKTLSNPAKFIKKRGEIIDFLKHYFIDKKANEVYLFGSVARNTHTDDSDIDIYLNFDKSVKISVFDLSKMKIEITIGTGRETDLVLKGSEYSFVKESLDSDKIKIYG